MTLLIGALANNTAFNISDRLLTQQLSRGGTFVSTQTFDDVSNKSIVYMGGNGMFCISFTGTAYINDIPTDRWVAEILSGMSLPEGSNYRYQGDIKKWDNTGMAMRAIIEELNRVWPTLSASQQKGDIGFLVTGWQMVGKRWKTILWGIVGSGTIEKPFRLKSFPSVHSPREIGVATAGASISSAEKETLSEKFLEEVKHGTSDSAQKVLTEELRTLAINRPTVGTDCMGVKMTWATTPYVTPDFTYQHYKKTTKAL